MQRRHGSATMRDRGSASMTTVSRGAARGILDGPMEGSTNDSAVKMDHNLSSKAKLSYYWSQTRTASQYATPLGGADGLPEPVTAAIGTFITSRVQRLNFDYTLAPTQLLHLGIGYQTDYFTDD